MNQALLEELQKRLDTLSDGLECALAALKAYEPQPYWSEATKSLVMRLRGIYAIGPEADQGIGEYGFHKFDNRPPIQLEAAERIAALEAENERLKDAAEEEKEIAASFRKPSVPLLKRINALEAEAQRWRDAHDRIIEYAASVEEKAKESIADVAAEIAALREDKARLVEALEKAVDVYGKPGGPWNVPSEPGSWLAQARAAIDAARKETPCPPRAT